ncbi:MAG: GNAT family N-acetyltransferase [Pirellulaceae bacterium]|nr:GNAT family N-acetyltransferase [Pirellulaceae bacterium]
MTDLLQPLAPPTSPISFRYEPLAEDAQRVRPIVESTGFFSVAEVDGRTVGYSCYGRIPATATSYELYWIAVDHDCQGRKFGRIPLDANAASVHPLVTVNRVPSAEPPSRP